MCQKIVPNCMPLGVLKPPLFDVYKGIYGNHTHQNLFLNQLGIKKKRIYNHTVEYRRGTFTPLDTSVDGLLHREAKHFLKRMATCIASTYSLIKPKS